MRIQGLIILTKIGIFPRKISIILVRKASRGILVLNILSVNIVGLDYFHNVTMINNKCESTDLGYSCVWICTPLKTTLYFHNHVPLLARVILRIETNNTSRITTEMFGLRHWQYWREFVFQCSFYFSLHQDLSVCSLQADHTTLKVKYSTLLNIKHNRSSGLVH